MNRAEAKKLLVGPIATVGTPFDKDYEVDYGRMAEMVRWWVANGLVRGRAVIKVAAAMGEGPQLSDTEWPLLLRTAVQAANGKATVYCGIHFKDTVRTIEDCRKALDLGADGVQINTPFINDSTQTDILRHYTDVSNAVKIPILVYTVPGYHNGAIDPDTIRKMTALESVVGIKWTPPKGEEYDQISDVAKSLNIIDNTTQPVRAHKLGARGFINWTCDIYPQFDLKVWDLLEAKNYAEAEAMWEPVYKPLREQIAKMMKYSGGQARMKKAMMAAMGNPIGSSRAPSAPATRQELAEVHRLLAGFGWPVTKAGSW
ncbi:MAG: dihydrodipicolinate synthase family protein [SAR202 cluster bacterium]|nr:dihydrodipicolinate synthase family protein [SAR202 cluster bacterium]